MRRPTKARSAGTPIRVVLIMAGDRLSASLPTPDMPHGMLQRTANARCTDTGRQASWRSAYRDSCASIARASGIQTSCRSRREAVNSPKASVWSRPSLNQLSLGKFPARDGEKRGDAGFRGEHVVAGIKQNLRAHVIADGEQPPGGIDKEIQIPCLCGQSFGRDCDRAQASAARARRFVHCGRATI